MQRDSGFRFELDRLTSYDRDEILRELVRVAGLVPGAALTIRAFDEHARVSSSTVRRTFGGWQAALETAGLAGRYAGGRVTPKMRSQAGRVMPREQMVLELRRVAHELGTAALTMEEFNRSSPTLNARAVISRFGSWRAGLEAAGLELSPRGRRHTEDEYFENLLTVWTHYGRTPHYGEMNWPPSVITAGAYERRWGTWTKARLAFVEAVNSGPGQAERKAAAPAGKTATARPAAVTSLSVGLRYQVLRRDRFRCVLCGMSPATDPRCILHVDHVVPVARGGLTILANLRALCQDCNLGKGSRLEGPQD